MAWPLKENLVEDQTGETHKSRQFVKESLFLKFLDSVGVRCRLLGDGVLVLLARALQQLAACGHTRPHGTSEQ